jgi:hypothetical protein
MKTIIIIALSLFLLCVNISYAQESYLIELDSILTLEGEENNLELFTQKNEIKPGVYYYRELWQRRMWYRFVKVRKTIHLNKDSTYVMKETYKGGRIPRSMEHGNWRVTNDTLILSMTCRKIGSWSPGDYKTKLIINEKGRLCDHIERDDKIFEKCYKRKYFFFFQLPSFMFRKKKIE